MPHRLNRGLEVSNQPVCILVLGETADSVAGEFETFGMQIPEFIEFALKTNAPKIKISETDGKIAKTWFFRSFQFFFPESNSSGFWLIHNNHKLLTEEEISDWIDRVWELGVIQVSNEKEVVLNIVRTSKGFYTWLPMALETFDQLFHGNTPLKVVADNPTLNTVTH